MLVKSASFRFFSALPKCSGQISLSGTSELKIFLITPPSTRLFSLKIITSHLMKMLIILYGQPTWDLRIVGASCFLGRQKQSVWSKTPSGCAPLCNFWYSLRNLRNFADSFWTLASESYAARPSIHDLRKTVIWHTYVYKIYQSTLHD